MNRKRRLATWLGTLLGTLSAFLLAAAQSNAADYRGRLTEEFHQTYSLSADGRVALDNINGAVHIAVWDRNEVKVDAIKSANRQERLDEAKIRVEPGRDSIRIWTEYPHRSQTFTNDAWDNPASVEYTLTVPRKANLDEIKLVNGALDIQGAAGEVTASCINGRLRAQGLAGRVKLSTINGTLEATFDRMTQSPVELSSINGSVDLTLPSNAKAGIEASTVHGGIANDFGLHVNNHRWVGHDLRGELGGGGARIRLNNVNGRIEIHHANDGQALSPARNLSDEDDENEI